MFNERNFENDRINFNRNINCESKNCFIVPESDVVLALNSLKTAKAAGDDNNYTCGGFKIRFSSACQTLM